MDDISRNSNIRRHLTVPDQYLITIDEIAFDSRYANNVKTFYKMYEDVSESFQVLNRQTFDWLFPT